MKQETTLTEAAVDYISAKSERAREYGLCYQAFKAGAEFQKEQCLKMHENEKANDIFNKLREVYNKKREQDKAIIEELLERLDITQKSLSTYGSHPIIELGNKVVIEKALNHIKTN